MLRMEGSDSFPADPLFWDPLRAHGVKGFIWWQGVMLRLLMRMQVRQGLGAGGGCCDDGLHEVAGGTWAPESSVMIMQFEWCSS